MTVTLPAVGRDFSPAPVEVKILSGQSESEVIKMANLQALAIITPVLEAATDRIQFKASHDGVTWSTGYVIIENATYYVQVPDVSDVPAFVELARLCRIFIPEDMHYGFFERGKSPNI